MTNFRNHLYFLLLGALALIVLPYFISSRFYIDVLTLIFFTAYLGQSWNILGGYAGQFSFGEPFECRSEIISQSRLNVMNKQCSNPADKDPEWDVDDPVNPEVQNCEGEQNCIPQNELVVSPMFPLFDADSLLTYV